MQTLTQVSAGGVVFRQNNGQIEVVLILVGPKNRWQLPKGAANQDESIEDAALREVREETGISAERLNLLDTIEYWFYAPRNGQRVRFHKFVHFFLMRYVSGSVEDHDHEVEEARWFPIDQAIEVLAFEGDKNIMRKARDQITAGAINSESVKHE